MNNKHLTKRLKRSLMLSYDYNMNKYGTTRKVTLLRLFELCDIPIEDEYITIIETNVYNFMYAIRHNLRKFNWTTSDSILYAKANDLDLYDLKITRK